MLLKGLKMVEGCFGGALYYVGRICEGGVGTPTLPTPPIPPTTAREVFRQNLQDFSGSVVSAVSVKSVFHFSLADRVDGVSKANRRM
jgi:hypothetical protein